MTRLICVGVYHPVAFECLGHQIILARLLDKLAETRGIQEVFIATTEEFRSRVEELEAPPGIVLKIQCLPGGEDYPVLVQFLGKLIGLLKFDQESMLYLDPAFPLLEVGTIEQFMSLPKSRQVVTIAKTRDTTYLAGGVVGGECESILNLKFSRFRVTPQLAVKPPEEDIYEHPVTSAEALDATDPVALDLIRSLVDLGAR